MAAHAAQVIATTARLAVKARRKLGSAATSRYHCVVNPVGRIVLSHSSPNDPVSNSAIGTARYAR